MQQNQSNDDRHAAKSLWLAVASFVVNVVRLVVEVRN